MNRILSYTPRKVYDSEGKVLALVFDFSPDIPNLSGFLGTDSPLIFGSRLENYSENLISDGFSAGGNAYSIRAEGENVIITFDLYFLYDDKNGLEEETVIPRDIFIRVMEEWVKEYRIFREDFEKRYSRLRKKRGLFL